MSLPPSAADFAKATTDFLDEVASLLGGERPTLPLVYSEAGIGGGARSLAAIATKPYEGQGYPRVDPWKSPERQALRLAYHQALCDYLADGEVERAFLWSEGPWDPQGIADERFRDPKVAKLIDAHNRR